MICRLAIRALVPGYYLGAVEQPHLAVVSDQRERALGVVGRHGVPVGVEADKGLTVRRNGGNQVGVGQRVGQCQL
jgi:hypothetical protein